VLGSAESASGRVRLAMAIILPWRSKPRASRYIIDIAYIFVSSRFHPGGCAVQCSRESRI